MSKTSSIVVARPNSESPAQEIAMAMMKQSKVMNFMVAVDGVDSWLDEEIYENKF